MAHLLIVDDEQSICWGLSKLAGEMGHSATTAASAEQALSQVEQAPPDAILLDVRLPGIDGLSAMGRFRQQCGMVPIVVMTAYGDLNTAVTAVRNGAFDYLTKPFNLQTARQVICRMLEHQSGPSEPAVVATNEDAGLRLVGRSPAMQEVFKRIALVAPSDACVHLYGESGTGKELVARAIHRHSLRHEGPFVAVNVASLSPSLAESEMFGHVRGAFTGADQPRSGLLERANRGTIFLDEVADIPLSLQVKLLRALEHGEILPVGGNRPVRTDFRIISATHRNLADQVAKGTFRHDLYYRLITFEVALPPLGQRCEDIPLLAEYFLDALAAKNRMSRATLTPDALAELQRRPWHGNVRELRNAIEHAMILAPGGRIAVDHLPPPSPPALMPTSLDETIRALVRRWAEAQLRKDSQSGDLHAQLLQLMEPPLLEAAMDHYHRQCAAAARRLGLHRTTLRKKLDQQGMVGEE
jgi:two-component system nitrogen regulation response regulator GlnG